VLHGAPTDSDPAILALFQAVAVPTAVGNAGAICFTVAPKTGDHIDLSETDNEFPPHSDSTFLRDPHHYIALACVRRDADSGGDSYVLTHDAVRDMVREVGGERIVRALGEPVYPFVLRDPLYGEGIQLVPVLGADGTIRYRKDMLDRLLSGRPELFAPGVLDALAVLDQVLDRARGRDCFVLAPGDMLVLDNRRVLHGRTPIRPGDR
jgi:hypothetical protein